MKEGVGGGREGIGVIVGMGVAVEMGVAVTTTIATCSDDRPTTVSKAFILYVMYSCPANRTSILLVNASTREERPSRVKPDC